MTLRTDPPRPRVSRLGTGSLALGLTTVIAAATFAAATPAAATVLEVVATKVEADQAPKIDGRADRIWQRQRGTRVTLTEGSQGDVPLTVKALYTDQHVYLFFDWEDRTESLNRLYAFDGTDWTKVAGNEDRLNVMWAIDDRLDGFAAKGCEALCHRHGSEVFLYTGGDDLVADLWHWKSQRTNPAGYADDQWLGNDLGSHDGEVTARRADAKTGGSYRSNFDTSARRPAFTFPAGARPGETLLHSVAVPVTDAMSFAPGTRLPRELLERPTGSRGDIDAGGSWRRGRYTLELRRARTTDDPVHDVQFTDTGRPYPFGVSVHDNDHEDTHAYNAGTALHLILQ